MKDTFFRLFFVGFAVCLSVVTIQAQGSEWTVPEEMIELKNSRPVSADVLKEGKAIFKQHCVLCHGKQGLGDGMMASALGGIRSFADASFTQQTDGALYWKITTGKAPMPSYKDKLSDDQRWALVHYIRSLAVKD